jgi:hypothetical protein
MVFVKPPVQALTAGARLSDAADPSFCSARLQD